MPSSRSLWQIRRRPHAAPLDKEAPRILFPRTSVNKPSQEMRQGSLCGMLQGASSREYKQREGEGTVVRQGPLIALVMAFLIGCAIFLMADASRVLAETRCEGTRPLH